MATFRQRVETHVAGSSIAITSAGAKSATKNKFDRTRAVFQSSAEYSPASCPGPEVAGSASAKSLPTIVLLLERTFIRIGTKNTPRGKQVIRFEPLLKTVM